MIKNFLYDSYFLENKFGIPNINKKFIFIVIGQKTYKYRINFFLYLTKEDNISDNLKISDLENPRLIEIQSYVLRIQIAAAAIASSLLLIIFPNIETISLTLFLSGLLFSQKYSLSIVLITAFGWELFASMIFGFSGITFLFKIMAWIIIAQLGHLARKFNFKKSSIFLLLGALSAIIYDIFVTIPISLFFINEKSSFIIILITSLIVGIPFTISHIIGNSLMFMMIPKLLDLLAPIINQKFSKITKLNITRFENPRENQSRANLKGIIRSKFTKGNILAVLLIIIIISSLIFINQEYNKPSSNQKENPIKIHVILNINYNGVLPIEKINNTLLNNNSVFDLIKNNSNVNYEIYGKLFYVEGINNVINNVNQTGYFWIFYINGIKSNKASNITFMNNNDIILWKYEKIAS